MAFFIGRNSTETRGEEEVSKSITYRQGGEVVKSAKVRKVTGPDGTCRVWVDAKGIPGAAQLTPPADEAKWDEWLHGLVKLP